MTFAVVYGDDGSAIGSVAAGFLADRLEKLGYLDGGAWLRWREIRNRLAHEYPDAPELRHAQLPAAIAGAADMLAAYRLWAGRLP